MAESENRVGGCEMAHYVQAQQWSYAGPCQQPGCTGTVYGRGIDPTGEASVFIDQDARCDTCDAVQLVEWHNGD